MKYLAIGPGALGIYSILGVIYYLKDKLKNVEEISGASAGSLIGLFLALDKNPEEIIKFLFELDLSIYSKLSLKNFLINFGFIDHGIFGSDLKKYLKSDPKFKDLSKKLYISVYNVNYEKTEYFSVDTHPEMSVIDTVCISMSIPIMCTSTKINGIYYIDGGIFERVPITPFINKPYKEVLGIEFFNKYYNNKEIKNIKDFLIFFYNKIINTCSEKHDKKIYNIISINHIQEINILNYKISHEEKMRMFFDGYNIARFHSGLTI